MHVEDIIELPVESNLNHDDKQQPNPPRNVLALGYKDKSGQIVVTDVLCFNFPQLNEDQIADVSLKLTTGFNSFYK